MTWPAGAAYGAANEIRNLHRQAAMNIVRIYTGDDGESHFEEIEVNLSQESIAGMLSELQPATGIVFRETGPDYDYNWHNAPRRQYVITLRGEFEVEIGDGSVRRLGPGDFRPRPRCFATMLLPLGPETQI